MHSQGPRVRSWSAARAFAASREPAGGPPQVVGGSTLVSVPRLATQMKQSTRSILAAVSGPALASICAAQAGGVWSAPIPHVVTSTPGSLDNPRRTLTNFQFLTHQGVPLDWPSSFNA